MRSEPTLKPEDSKEEFYEDPIFTKENRYLEKKFDTLTGIISPEESAALENFINSKLSASTTDLAFSQVCTLQYRPDEWDSMGVVQKVQDIAREHIYKTYAVSGQLEPRSFTILRTEDVQTYKEEYGLYNQNNEILYTAIVTASHPDDYYSGETLYLNNGEGFRPARSDIVIHRNERLNDWEIVEVVTGVRLDLIIVFQEIDRKVSYDYPIDQLDESSVSF
jgi:hypothetical protein